MECLDSGMVLFRETCDDAQAALRVCYAQAFDKDFDGNDIVVLMEE